LLNAALTTARGLASWELAQGGLPRMRVTSARAEGALFAHGAHVTEWRPFGHDEVLFVSKRSAYGGGKAIRGGVPVCFPWFAARRDDPRPNGATSPAHGFARTRAWEVRAVTVEDHGVRVACELPTDDEQQRLWNDRASVVLEALFGDALELSLTVTNTTNQAFTYEAALHSYFRVGDATRVVVSGLDGLRYSDKTLAGAMATQPPGSFTLVGETDRIYHDPDGPVVLTDPALARALRIEQSPAARTVLWNPGSSRAAAMPDLHPDGWREFVCVEAACCGDAAVTLAPGASHTLSQRVTVQR
jgi:glucose-6-phosphate 1-epimerase